MFGLFKKKSEKDKLILIYNKIKKKAFDQSKINRKESDRLEVEAHEILKKIDLIEKEENPQH